MGDFQVCNFRLPNGSYVAINQRHGMLKQKKAIYKLTTIILWGFFMEISPTQHDLGVSQNEIYLTCNMLVVATGKTGTMCTFEHGRRREYGGLKGSSS